MEVAQGLLGWAEVGQPAPGAKISSRSHMLRWAMLWVTTTTERPVVGQ
ncbi:FHA modulated ABC efflux pump with fused ATPase and integral membrane subunits domain protein [Mycobacterium kansasii 662]|uniref:FHA modulated ABC efflux pump with fused ATPase and integral membrane subunits domain protein n=1 Tax=Mycobacterium kansasii 662 TaxID=1299326 RepID=X7XWM5_MYCKA|nr:FHA modulated ABC efflux pump with fused ATPase and integral membrane subunits domain protein [Mycobacterium kansasii 662]